MRTAPYFDDLRPGDVLDDAPALTITEGHAATHQAIVGDRLRVALDADLARRVIGGTRGVVHPGLVCDVAIGQSTQVTQRVVANLFYRGLVLHGPVRHGDTLRTTTRVEALRENTRRPGRAPTGLALLHMRSEDQDGGTVLDFRRCAMLPLSPDAPPTGRDDDVGAAEAPLDDDALERAARPWDVAAYRAALPHGRHFADVPTGPAGSTTSGDVVSNAPELARLTLNVAGAHHDADAAGGRRLVYGGHTIGIAAAQLCRLLPDLVTVIGWDRCDHTGPVHEGDTLHGAVEVADRSPREVGGGLVRLRVRVQASRPGGDGPPEQSEVLDWQLVGLMA